MNRRPHSSSRGTLFMTLYKLEDAAGPSRRATRLDLVPLPRMWYRPMGWVVLA